MIRRIFGSQAGKQQQYPSAPGQRRHRSRFELLEDRRMLTVAFDTVHNFAGSPDDGSGPSYGSALAADGSTLYGMASHGGADGDGVIYSVNADGSDYTILHSFSGGDGGANPVGSLTLIGSTLYGTTETGGTANVGTVFSMSSGGSDFTVLHSFAGGDGGGFPYAGVTAIGSTLYGTTNGGGAMTLDSLLGH